MNLTRRWLNSNFHSSITDLNGSADALPFSFRFLIFFQKHIHFLMQSEIIFVILRYHLEIQHGLLWIKEH